MKGIIVMVASMCIMLLSGLFVVQSSGPDLVVSDISWSPSSPKEGDLMTFTVYIKNQGSENAGYFKILEVTQETLHVVG